MKIKLTRDEARAIDTRFFPYMERLCELQIETSRGLPETNINSRIIRSCLLDLIQKIKKRLLSAGNNFTITLKENEGLVFYELLMILPLDPAEVWLNNLRQQMIHHLHLQIV